MDLDRTMRAVIRNQLIDALLETADEIDDTLARLRLPQGSVCADDLAEDSIERCRLCLRWFHTDDMDADMACFECAP